MYIFSILTCNTVKYKVSFKVLVKFAMKKECYILIFFQTHKDLEEIIAVVEHILTL